MPGGISRNLQQLNKATAQKRICEPAITARFSLLKKKYHFAKMHGNDLINSPALRPRGPFLFRSAGKGSKRGRFARHFGNRKIQPGAALAFRQRPAAHKLRKRSETMLFCALFSSLRFFRQVEAPGIVPSALSIHFLFYICSSPVLKPSPRISPASATTMKGFWSIRRIILLRRATSLLRTAQMSIFLSSPV